MRIVQLLNKAYNISLIYIESEISPILILAIYAFSHYFLTNLAKGFVLFVDLFKEPVYFTGFGYCLFF